MSWLVVLGWLRKVPREVWLLLAVALAFLWLRSHWIGVGVERCRSAQEAAEAQADAKALKAAGRATAKADAASVTIKKETDNAAAEVRYILRDRVCPAVPERVHDLGREAVERARRGLRPAEG